METIDFNCSMAEIHPRHTHKGSDETVIYICDGEGYVAFATTDPWS